MQDISKSFKWNPRDAKIGKGIVEREAIVYFSENCEGLTDYAYWFYLSTMWVSYSGKSDLSLWKRLFGSQRKNRKQSVMKPSEIKAFDQLPYFVTVYRAHRSNETDWIAYTLYPMIAARFAAERGVGRIAEYKVKKKDVAALFLRRGEKEVIVLDKDKVQFIQELEVVHNELKG